MRTRVHRSTVSLFTLLRAVPAHADDWHCPSMSGGNDALAEQDPGERIRYVQRHLDDDAQRVRIWAWSFAALHTGLTAGNGAQLVVARTHARKVDQVFATAASAFGLLVLAIMPPSVLRDQPRLTRIVRSYEDPGDRCGVLAAAERIDLRAARSEAFGRGPLVHAGSFVFDATLGALLLAVWHHPQTAAIVEPVGIAGGEGQQGFIWTRTSESSKSYPTVAATCRTAGATRSRGRSFHSSVAAGSGRCGECLFDRRRTGTEVPPWLHRPSFSPS